MTNNNQWLTEILEKVKDWHGFREKAITALQKEIQEFIDTSSWASELLKQERIKIAKQLILQKISELETEARIDELSWYLGHNHKAMSEQVWQRTNDRIAELVRIKLGESDEALHQASLNEGGKL